MEDQPDLVEMTADIISAYVAANSVSTSALPELIHSVHGALSALGGQVVPPAPEPQEPAVPIKKSITPEYLICLEDGKRFKSLKRHLRAHYNMSPEDYRAKWGLAKDYPMVSPNYARSRSDLARRTGLGQGGRTA